MEGPTKARPNSDVTGPHAACKLGAASLWIRLCDQFL